MRTYSEARYRNSSKQSHEAFFVLKGDKFRGRPVTALPTVDNKDLIRIPARELKFKTRNDLDHLRSIAKDRTKWSRRLSANIREAAEASKSKH